MSTTRFAELPATAPAALLREYGADLEVVELPVPHPEPGALVVSVELASVCGSDVHTWQGSVSPLLPIRPPLVLGHEIVGRVAAIGTGAELDSVGQPVHVGDRIVWEHAACGRCRMCTVERQPTLCPNRQVGMFHSATEFPYTAGGFSTYSYVWPKSGRLLVPQDVPSDAAAAGSCALRTIVSAMDRLGPIDHLSSVVVQGSGPLGLFATAMIARHHPRKLIVVGAPDDRLDLAIKWGADAVVSVQRHPTSTERIAMVEELTDGGPSVLIEASGAPGAFAEGVMMAARNARYAVVGTLGGPDQQVPVARIVGRGLRIVGCLGADIGAYYGAMQFLSAGRQDFNWSDLFSGRRHPLNRATDALRSLRSMDEIKPIIDPAA